MSVSRAEHEALVALVTTMLEVAETQQKALRLLQKTVEVHTRLIKRVMDRQNEAK